MPYANIVFVKIKMDLAEDDRFLIDLNDTQKGLYLMLLMLAGKTNNHIRNDMSFIKGRLGLKTLDESDILRISEVFPKFKCISEYWKFEDFEEIHNYTLGKSKGTPKEIPKSKKGTPKEVERVEQKEKEKKKENQKENEKEAGQKPASFIKTISKKLNEVFGFSENSQAMDIHLDLWWLKSQHAENPIGYAIKGIEDEKAKAA